MSFTQNVLAKADERCIVHQCETAAGCAKSIPKEGASFSLDGSPAPHALADFDKPPLYGANRRRCDFLFIADLGDDGGSGWLVLIEMSSGKKRAGEVFRQLRAGSELIDGIIPRGFEIEFRVVLVGRMNGREKRNLDKPEYQIRFRGVGPYRVKVIPDKSKLANALTRQPVK